jgi:hypothetical protein
MLFAIAGDAIFPGDAGVGQVSTFEHTSCRKVGFLKILKISFSFWLHVTKMLLKIHWNSSSFNNSCSLQCIPT